MKKRVARLLIVIALILSSVTVAFADTVYTVKAGDVLWKIAKKHNVSWQELAKLNKLKNPNIIYPGQILKIAGQAPKLDVDVSGNGKTKVLDSGQAYEVISQKTMVTSRGVKIPATFVYPKANIIKKFPLLVMAHGHGGNREEGGGFTRVAEGLAAKGIASIRIDFPGCGESTEPFTQNCLTNMMNDIKASLDYAIAKPMIDTNKIGMFGYSMGGRLAMLSVEKDSRYDVLALWSPLGTNGMESGTDFLGGQKAYNAMNKEAKEKGFVTITTIWGQKQDLSEQWFTDLNASKPLDSISGFTGPVLVLYGEKDVTVKPIVDKAVIKAAVKSSKIVEHVVIGADHGFGFYTPDAAISADTVNTTIEFLTSQLVTGTKH